MIKKLLDCQRGAVALAFVIAAVPMLGIAALATEGGVWYVAKRSTQNAADAGAYAAALRLIYTVDSSSVDDRGRQFAAQNGYCPGGLSTLAGANCLPMTGGISHSVLIEPGTYTGPGTFTPSAVASATAVRATVTQTQPLLLATVFRVLNPAMSSNGQLAIRSQATAAVLISRPNCLLGLTGLTIGGNANLTGGNCSLKSNQGVNVNGSPTFSGSNWAVEGVTGCVKGGTSTCDSLPVSRNLYSAPAPNPFSELNLGLFTSSTTPVTPCVNNLCVPNSTANPYSNLTVGNNQTVTMAPGTYVFRDATIRINGGSLRSTGPVNIVLLGSSSITMNGNGVINLTGGSGTSVLSNPAMNSGAQAALNGVVIYQAGTGNVSINGAAGSSLSGAIYAPNADLTLSGTAASVTCFQAVAKTVTIQGTYTLDTSGCPASTISKNQYVALVE